jgi:DNA-binding NarL/FixJ family response regulator
VPIKVSIIEDDTPFRESVVAWINGTEGFNCVGAYPNGEVALREMPDHWPDVVLMDINLPRMSGIICVSKLKAMRPSLHIIMLTAYVEEEPIFDSLKAGASGYLIKKTSPAKILDAITDVHGGGAPMSNAIALKVIQHFQQHRAADEVQNLSAREHEILGLMAKGHQYKEIGDLLSISPLTVRTHIRRIYDKLHVTSRTEAVLKFLGKTP